MYLKKYFHNDLTSTHIIWIYFGVLLSILLRVCTSLHSHSGQGKPPMFGDYEAQRHWMEITYNLPIEDWYHHTKDNDLQYWGLDYPPLTAYHSVLCGFISNIINPDFVKLGKSRGYESESHKLFMRYSVLIVDILFYVPVLIIYFIVCKECMSLDTTIYTKRNKKSLRFPVHYTVVVALLYPGLILIDHGHFQYNCVSLGLAILAVTFIICKKNIFGSIAFCLALNYKQMELYHAFPFFFYLLSYCIPKPGEKAFNAFLRLTKIATSVLITFAIVWLPFLTSLQTILQVIHRLFPISRGVFEDKVANVWCSLNVLFKFNLICKSTMLRYCTLVTLGAILPSNSDLFLRPNIKKFVPALINSSLAFYLFSFQVHEKSILLAAIPVVMYIHEQPFICFWFLQISSISMFPLFIKDNLVIPFIALNIFYSCTFWFIYSKWRLESAKKLPIFNVNQVFCDFFKLTTAVFDYKKDNREVYEIFRDNLSKNASAISALLAKVGMFVSLLVGVALCTASLLLKPPLRYPDLFTLLISIYCCCHFILFFAYFNYVQLKIPQDFDLGYAKKIKKKVQ